MAKMTPRGLTLLAGAAGLGLTLLSTQANATAFAYSALEVTNFSLNTSVFGGFSTFQFTSQPLSASLNGTTVNSPAIQTSNVSGGTTNQSQLKLGSTGFAADNLYFGANRPTFQNPNADFAVSDSHQTDTRISTGCSPCGNFGTQSGAQGTGKAGDGAADTGADNSLSWNFNVSDAEIAGGPIALDFSFNTLSNVFAQTQFAGETARAVLSMTIQLVLAGQVVSEVDVFDENFNLQFPGTAGDPNEIAQSFTSADFDPMLISAAGDYTLNFLYDSSAQVSSVSVPEPGTLGLLGLGLIGLGAAGYRRRRAA